MSPPDSHCPDCQGLLPATLGGLCPHCMWGETLLPEGSGGPAGHVLGAELARGGMGIVYTARQLTPGRTVAIKMLRPHLLEQEEMRRRFLQEAQAAGALRHPAILPVYQVGECDGVPWFSMMLAESGTLSARRDRYAGKWRECAGLVAALARAVGFAHGHGVLHRDLKPGNILFDAEDRAYVCDFGLAKVATAGETTPDWTRSLQILGTPHYLPPEVAAGTLKQATTSGDIYSLGVILYELLAGRVPFDAENVPALLRKIADEEAGSLSSGAVPEDLAAVTLKCLEKNPVRRYPTAAALAEDLDAWLEGRPVTARRLARFQKWARWMRRNPVPTVLSALLVLAVGAGILHGWRRQVELRRAFADTRLSESDYRRRADREGRQTAVLETIRSTTGLSDPVHVRSSLAAALAVTDLTQERQWPVHSDHFESQFDFTSDLSRYAVAVVEGGFGVFDTASGQRLRHFPARPDAHEMTLQFGPGDRWLAVTRTGGWVEFHDWQDPARPALVLRREAGNPAHLTFSPDGTQCLVLTENRGGRLVSLADGGSTAVSFPLPPVPVLEPESKQGMNGAAWSPDGKLLALAWERTFQVVRWPDFSVVHSSNQPQWLGDQLAWAPDGKTVLFRDLAGGVLRRLDLEKGRIREIPTLHRGKIRSIRFHPDGRTVATAGWDGRLVLTDVDSNPRTPLQIPAATGALRLSADGTRLACCPDNTHAAIYRLIDSPVFRRWADPPSDSQQIFTISVSPDGRWLATAESEAVRFYDTATGLAVAKVPRAYSQWWRAALFGADPTSFITSAYGQGVHRIPLTVKDGILQPGEPVQLGSDLQIIPQEFMDGGRTLVLLRKQQADADQGARAKGEVSLWPEADPARARLVIPAQVPMVGFRPIPGTAFGISTDLLDTDVRVWNLATGQQVRTLGLAEKASTDISRDGRYLAVSHGDTYSLWDTATWRRLTGWPAPNLGIAARVPFFTPDSRMVLTPVGNGGEFDLRSVPEGRLIATLVPPAVLFPLNISFSPDSRHLYISTDTRQIVEWDLGKIREAWAEAGVPDGLE